MSTHHDNTPVSRTATKEYRDNWDLAFGITTEESKKKKCCKDENKEDCCGEEDCCE